MKMLVKRAGYWSLFFLIGGFAHFADGEAPFKATGGRPIVDGQFKTWHVADGLPFNRMEDVIQRKNGFIWVATMNGAARFDGIKFEVFNQSKCPGLPDNLIASLHEDAAGRLFLGHESGQVSVKTASGFVGIKVPPKFDGRKVRGFSESASGGRMGGVWQARQVACCREVAVGPEWFNGESITGLCSVAGQGERMDAKGQQDCARFERQGRRRMGG